MAQIDKTVFLSYSRVNAPWALAIFQNLTQHGYDVFFDFSGASTANFESVILANIRARAHFVVLITPSALERCNEPGDWLRQEMEAALTFRRNIVPIMIEGSNFSTPGINSKLTGPLAALKKYNALSVPAEYFTEAMDRLRTKFLSVPVETMLAPVEVTARRTAKDEQAVAGAAPAVTESELTAQEWYERGVNETDAEEKIRLFTEAIRLKPDHADAFYGRGLVRHAQGDLSAAEADYAQVITLRANLEYTSYAYKNRGIARYAKGDFEEALSDYSEAIRLKADHVDSFYGRGLAHYKLGNLEAAINDYNEVIQLQPDYTDAFYNRGNAREAKGDLEAAIDDYNEAIRLKPGLAEAFYNRARSWQQKNEPAKALDDYQRYLDLGGGERDGDTEQVRQLIRDLQAKL